jgi:pimeloyl-ACP methyl ester carboxylesterase
VESSEGVAMIHLEAMDYSALDRPEVLMYVFHPRPEPTFRSETGGEDLLIPVEEAVAVGARFHAADEGAPTILFFHGNGEIVADYDDLGPMFTAAGANFLPVDYRGYGRSTGRPTITSMMRDCHRVYDFVKTWLGQRGCTGPIVAAGRSLGSASALELASTYGHPEIAGLVVESGFARVSPLLHVLGIDTEALGFREDRGFRNVDKIRKFHGPTLVIHGELDYLIPVANAHALFEACEAPDKRLLLLAGADHNSVFLYGIAEYQEAVGELIRKVCAAL